MSFYKIRRANINDQKNILLLYKKVITHSDALARTSEEITKEYVFELLMTATKSGLALVILDGEKIIGSMIKHTPGPILLAHLFSQGSILIHPNYQRKGLGSQLISSFLREVEEKFPHILRVEVIVRESSPAVLLYQKLGFTTEGRFERGIRKSDNTFEAGIFMTWFNPSFNLGAV